MLQRTKTAKPWTHEEYVHAVARLAIDHLQDPAEKARASAIKLVYGSGPAGTRGVTFFGSWAHKPAGGEEQPASVPFVEICAFGQEGWTQIAGTTIHELGHVVAGPGCGHGKEWHAACARLGLRAVRAAGTDYKPAMFAPALREAIAALPLPEEGAPQRLAAFFGRNVTLKPCGAGIGTRGGKSRGAGSGSRLRLYTCECEPPVRVRVASDAFRAHCDHCSAPFTREEPAPKPEHDAACSCGH